MMEKGWRSIPEEKLAEADAAGRETLPDKRNRLPEGGSGAVSGPAAGNVDGMTVIGTEPAGGNVAGWARAAGLDVAAVGRELAISAARDAGG